jgi:hypothetical protein
MKTLLVFVSSFIVDKVFEGVIYTPLVAFIVKTSESINIDIDSVIKILVALVGIVVFVEISKGADRKISNR